MQISFNSSVAFLLSIHLLLKQEFCYQYSFRFKLTARGTCMCKITAVSINLPAKTTIYPR